MSSETCELESERACRHSTPGAGVGVETEHIPDTACVKTFDWPILSNLCFPLVLVYRSLGLDVPVIGNF